MAALGVQVLLPPDVTGLGLQATEPPTLGLAAVVMVYWLAGIKPKVPVTVHAPVTGPAVMLVPDTLTVPHSVLLPAALLSW